MILEWKTTGVIIEESPISGKFQLNNMYYINWGTPDIADWFQVGCPKIWSQSP